jgi:hypothetical protein
MIHELPATAQRAIARAQHISLPRRATPAERAARLQRALVRAAAVRAGAAHLDDAARAALTAASRRGGVPVDEFQARFGAPRPWRVLLADPRPVNATERLLLLGWLLPRPAWPGKRPRYLMPPELRRWLPVPPRFAEHGPAPPAPPPLALRGATALLLAAAAGELTLRRDGRPAASALADLAGRLAPLPAGEVRRLTDFLAPLLSRMGLLAGASGPLALTPAGHRFLALPPTERLAALDAAWLDAPGPEAWLAAVAPRQRGLDWPVLRRRLTTWAAALPAGRLVEPGSVYPALAAAFGPLADAHTHGYRRVTRSPWRARRAEAVLLAALRGPLHWLGRVAWHDGRLAGTPDLAARLEPPAPWRYGPPGRLIVPHGRADAALLALERYATRAAADAAAATYAITRATLARAASAGWGETALWTLLTEQAGPPPAAWRAAVGDPLATARLFPALVLAVEPPALLARALRARAVRRCLIATPAPGLALVDPARAARLTRALARAGIAVTPGQPPTT